ncbi:MAG: hypothetical protein M3Z05_11515 [Gemmatimonadota bacterium]|nr:hypothetical protein [Gemmatimonadota bacterium]
MAAILLAAPGCSLLRSTIGAYETGPNGIIRSQQQLREALVHADYATALGWPEDDALLRALDVGATSFYASRFARSAAILDSAALMADDRITNSLSANALALVSSDLARPYQARRTERLFIPYYAMLAFARLEQWEDAAVEARRLSGLLSEYAADCTDAERPTHAMLHYLSGTVFERAGEKNDAQVAYRLARALLPTQVDSVRGRTARGEGEMLVVLERGFVAHRATESISVFLGDSDGDSLADSRRASGAGTVRAIAGAMSSSSRSESSTVRSDRTRKPRWEYGHHDDDDGYWLRVSFPSVRRAPLIRGEPSLVVDGEQLMGARVGSVLDDAVSADEDRERAALIARAVARSAAKYAVTRAVKDSKGEVAGSIANIGAALLERADVRSWHVLPQTVTLLRVRAPAGQRRLLLDVGEGLGQVDLGKVRVQAGVVTIITARVWSEPLRAGLLAVAR